ncbi:MAG: STAS domain-containing protein, partial [Tissierellia bacterium]|nr:STAS domain-containing protein [Tissierellia bacterium]
MSLDINIKFNEDDNIWVVYPKGEIDIYTSPELKEVLTEALNENNGDILID